MKKICTLFAAGLLIASLTGCAGAASDGSNSNSLNSNSSGSNHSNSGDSSSLMSAETDNASSLVSPGTDSAGAQSANIPRTASAPAFSSNGQNAITVNSSEKVTVVPDIAEVVYSVRTEAREAADCQQQNQASVSQVIECLKSLNIAESSIQTSDYSMYPIYNYSNNTTRVTGYEAVTTLTVSDLPIDGLDELLSRSVSTGINTISSITYQASRYDESYQMALARAVEAARQKAQVLADAAGCSVDAVLNIRETSGYSQARYSDYALTSGYNSAARKEAALEDMAGIMPGEIQVEAAVVVEYQLY